MDLLTNKDIYVNECMKQLMFNNDDEKQKIKAEFIQKLNELNKHFQFKCNVKSFNYIENNAILNIVNFLPLTECFSLMFVSKKYFNFVKKYNNNNKVFEIQDFYHHNLINIFENVKFKFDFRKHKHIKRTKRNALKFKDCYDLNLYNYPNRIVDFLKNIKILNLFESYRITDVSSLINVHTLNLSWCVNIKDFKVLGNGNIQCLDLTHTNITNCENLGNIPNITLDYCHYLKSLKGLTNLDYLSCFCCNNLIDMSTIQYSKYLDVRRSRFITNDKLKHIKYEKIFI